MPKKLKPPRLPKTRKSIYLVFDKDVEPGFAEKIGDIARRNRRYVKQEVIAILKKHADEISKAD